MAAATGIEEGDRILFFDGEPVADSFDLVYAIKTKSPGDSAIIELKRGNETLRVEAYFAAKP